MSATTPGRVDEPPARTLRSKRKSLLASTVGNVLEWYEWSAYAVFTPFIAAVIGLLGVDTPSFRVGRKHLLLSAFGVCTGFQAAKT
ncbi:hypothetical protein ACWGSK_25435 [Nocardiopsis sp. NPDC055551]|uniref:hypothetical protein n=1 Tax=Nocardiopsis sp. NPDC006832 TaxID=3157188 RepID=UPI0033FDF361